MNETASTRDQKNQAGARESAPTAFPATISSEQLFRNQKSLQIAHEGQLYLLRITRDNKLILTK